VAWDDGFVFEHRSVMEHAVFQDDWLYRLFRWCVMKANYAPGNYRGTPVPVGSFITGKLRAAEELGVTPSKWFRGIHRLAEAPYEVISIQANREWTMLTVVNYKTYQTASSRSEPPANPERTASEPPANPIEESNKSIKQESNNKPKAKGEPDKRASPQVDVEGVRFPEFPCVIGRRSKEPTWTLTDSLVADLQEVFTGVDVPGQCREAHLWCKTNKSDRKTADGMPEFLRKWMKRQQNQKPFTYQKQQTFVPDLQ
jgi:hypothetical protein